MEEADAVKAAPMKFICLLLLAGGIVACGGGSPTGDRNVTTGGEAAPRPPSAGPDQGPGTVNVSMRDIAFVPARAQIELGQTVKWTNADAVVHDVTASGGEFESGTVQGTDDFEFTPTRRGTLSYVCTIHGEQMSGTLVVR